MSLQLIAHTHIHRHTLERQSCVVYVCRERRGWVQKTWANSCGLWDYPSLSLCLSACLVHSSTQSFSHQRGITPHTLLVMFPAFFFPSLKPYLCLYTESPGDVIVTDISARKTGWRNDKRAEEEGKGKERKFLELVLEFDLSIHLCLSVFLL